jgi:hypothetical protein
MRIDGIQLSQGSSISNLVVASGTSFPAQADAGELFYRTDSDVTMRGMYCYIGTAWDRISSTASTTVPVGSTLPSSAVTGDLFYLDTNNSFEGLYAYTGTQWALTGNAIAVSYTITGDVNGTIDGGIDSLSLANVNAAPQTDTFRRLTVSSKGLVTDTSAVQASDITTALGFTPYNVANPTGYITGNQSITASGDVTGTGTTAITMTLVAVGTAGVKGSASSVPVFTTDTKGRVTANTDTAINIAASQVGSGTFADARIASTSVTQHEAALALAASQITSGSFTDVRIAQSNVTQHQAALTILESQITDGALLARVGGNETITGTWTFNNSVSSITPTTSSHLTTKAYVDSVLAGLSWKQPVKVATTANITLAGIQTIDGNLLVAGDRVLAKDQTTQSQNGVYVVAAGAWTRATDFDNTAPIDEVNSAAVFVMVGANNADTGWTQSAPVTTVGADAMTFIQFSASGSYLPGAGLVLNGKTFDIVSADIGRIVVGVDSIDLATVGSAGTYKSVTTDAYGRVTSGTNPTTLAGYGITDAQALDADLTAIAALNSGNIGLLRKTAPNTWSLDTSAYLTSISSGDVTTALGFTPYNATNPNNYISGNQTVTLSGDASGSGATAITVTLANVATAGTYKSVTINAKGLVTGGTNPTTLAGYGITDAQALDADLTAIAALAGTSGMLIKTAANTWALDTSTYLTTITSGQIVTALGFTPYDATNPAGYTTNVGTVTTASVVSANGFAGTVATAGTTPAITLTTTASGMLKGSSSALVAATAGTDFSAGTAALGTGILKSTTTTGALTIAVAADFPTLNQNTTGSAATLTTSRNFSASGDATAAAQAFNGSANVVLPLVLATVNSTVGTFGSSSDAVAFTVNAKGLVTAAASAPIAIAASQTNSGTFADGRIAASNVTQHQAALTILETQITDGTLLARNAGNETITGNWTHSGTLSAAEPTLASHVATKNYVDNAVLGLTWKAPVAAATTANITLSAPQTIDGVAVVAGNRVLVKDQTTASQNGVYVVAAGAWTRATDFDAVAPIDEINSAAVFVKGGTINADTGWTQGSVVVTVGTDTISFVQFSASGAYTWGNGLVPTGNTINVVGNAGRIVANANDIDLATVGTAITDSLKKITTDAYGRVTASTAVVAADITGISGLTTTIGSTAINLGSSATTLAGLTSVTSTTFVGALTGNVTGSASLNVLKTGDTMTGAFAVSPASGDSSFTVNTAAAGGFALISLKTAGLNRWVIAKDNVAEGGSSAGSNLAINRYDDAGTFISIPLTINRATGLTTVSSLAVTGALTASGGITGTITGASSLNVLKAGDTMTGQLNVSTNSGSVSSIQITDTGANGANIRLVGDGATTPNKTIRSSAGNFDVLNSAYSAAILRVTDAGNLSVTGSFFLNNAQYAYSKMVAGTTIRMLGINASDVAYIGPMDAGPTTVIHDAATSITTSVFYTGGTEKMRIDNNGNVGIGNTPTIGYSLHIAKTMTGATSSVGVVSAGVVQSDVTNTANYFATAASTLATAFTLSNLNHFKATQGTIGAGSTVTLQTGFMVDATMTGATTNYGFYGNLAAAAGRYNLYMSGDADNYLAGRLGIGATPLVNNVLTIGKNITGGATAYGLYINSTVQSDVTSNTAYYRAVTATAAAAFTLTNLRGFQASQGTLGASSVVSNQMGFSADATIAGGASNFGFHSDIAIGANNYNFYANSTAKSYFGGNVGIGSGKTSPGTALDVNGTVTSTAVSINGVGLVDSATLTTSATTADQVIDTNAITAIRAVKYQITVNSGSAYSYTEVAVMHDGTNVYMTETSTMNSGAALATFNADINTGNLRLLTTPVNAVTTYKVVAIAVAV